MILPRLSNLQKFKFEEAQICRISNLEKFIFGEAQIWRSSYLEKLKSGEDKDILYCNFWEGDLPS